MGTDVLAIPITVVVAVVIAIQMQIKIAAITVTIVLIAIGIVAVAVLHTIDDVMKCNIVTGVFYHVTVLYIYVCVCVCDTCLFIYVLPSFIILSYFAITVTYTQC